jgi:hypothetical protein
MLSRWRLIWADQTYAGQLITWVEALRVHRLMRLGIARRTGSTKDSAVSLKQWSVERMLGWLKYYWRSNVNYELSPKLMRP